MKKSIFGGVLQSRLVFLFVGLVAGCSATYFVINAMQPRDQNSNEFRALSTRGHTLTSPLLSCTDIPESLSIGDRKNLEESIQQIISSAQSSGAIRDASVYYRDLNNGPWFGINQEATFDPASLFKVPLAMTYFWESNEGSDILNDQIEYKSPAGFSVEFFPTPHPLVPGTVYTIQQLIEFMLKYSDNDAAVVLSEYAGLEKRNELYEDLGLRPYKQGEQYVVDVHTYASFFRILYNATYLGVRYSELALKILSESTFTNGLVAGVPQGTIVAHKFGEHVSDGPNGKVYQLHDCGIVYAPGRPYVLCVMTRGTDMDKLPNFIGDVSRTVYEGVTK